MLLVVGGAVSVGSLVKFFHFCFLRGSLQRISLRRLLPHGEVRVSVRAVKRFFCNGQILVAKTTNDVNQRVTRRVTVCGPRQLILMSRTRAPLRRVCLLVTQTFPKMGSIFRLYSVYGARYVRRIFRRGHPSFIFRTTTCGRIPVLRGGPGKDIRGGIGKAHVITSLTIGCKARGFMVISASGTIGPAGMVKYSGQVYRVCIRDLSGTLGRKEIGNGAQFIAAHFKGILKSGNSIISLFVRRVGGNKPIAIARPGVMHCFVLVPRTYDLILSTKLVKRKKRVCTFSVNSPIGVISLTGQVVHLDKTGGVGVRFANLQGKRGLCRRILTRNRRVRPAIGDQVGMTGIQRCSCRRVSHRVSDLVGDLPLRSSVRVMEEVGRLIPRCIDHGSGCRILSIWGEGHGGGSVILEAVPAPAMPVPADQFSNRAG